MEQDEPPQEPPWVTEAEVRVAETKWHVAAQMALIAEMRRLDCDTTEATAALIVLTDQLLRCYEELGRQKAGGWRQPRRPLRRPPDDP